MVDFCEQMVKEYLEQRGFTVRLRVRFFKTGGYSDIDVLVISVELLLDTLEERKNDHGGKSLRIGLKILVSEWKSGGTSYGIDSEDTM